MWLGWDNLVGIPFKDKGRDMHGSDCYGLFRLALMRGKGLLLDLHDNDYQGREDKYGVSTLIAQHKINWDLIPKGEEKPFDAILMAVRDFQHLGIVVSPGFMLHMPRDSSSVIERYDTIRYASAIRGFYRYRTRDETDA